MRPARARASGKSPLSLLLFSCINKLYTANAPRYYSQGRARMAGPHMHTPPPRRTTAVNHMHAAHELNTSLALPFTSTRLAGSSPAVARG